MFGDQLRNIQIAACQLQRDLRAERRRLDAADPPTAFMEDCIAEANMDRHLIPRFAGPAVLTACKNGDATHAQIVQRVRGPGDINIG